MMVKSSPSISGFDSMVAPPDRQKAFDFQISGDFSDNNSRLRQRKTAIRSSEFSDFANTFFLKI